MYIHKQSLSWSKRVICKHTHDLWTRPKHSRHQTVQSERGKSRAGHGLGDECETDRAGQAMDGEMEVTVSRLGEAQVWVLKRHLLFRLWGPSADTRQDATDLGISYLAQINPGGTRHAPSSPHTHQHLKSYCNTRDCCCYRKLHILAHAQ